LVESLKGLTEQGNRVAAAIQSGDLKLNVLSDRAFEQTYRQLGGTRKRAPQAFALDDDIYVRSGSKNLRSEIVHEGTHGLDYLGGFKGTECQWEKRAYFFECQFQKAGGGDVEFATIKEMLEHIDKYYKRN
jgi:hypothetical protein